MTAQRPGGERDGPRAEVARTLPRVGPAQIAGLAAIYETGPVRVYQLARPCWGVYPRQFGGPPGLLAITFRLLENNGLVEPFAGDLVKDVWDISQLGIDVLLAHRPDVEPREGRLRIEDGEHFLNWVEEPTPVGAARERVSEAARATLAAMGPAAPGNGVAEDRAAAVDRSWPVWPGVRPLSARVNRMLDVLFAYAERLTGCSSINGAFRIDRDEVHVENLYCSRESYDSNVGPDDKGLIEDLANRWAGRADGASPHFTARLAFALRSTRRRAFRRFHVEDGLDVTEIADHVRDAALLLRPANLFGRKRLGLYRAPRHRRVEFTWYADRHGRCESLGQKLGGRNSLRLTREAIGSVERWIERFPRADAEMNTLGFVFTFAGCSLDGQGSGCRRMPVASLPGSADSNRGGRARRS